MGCQKWVIEIVSLSQPFDTDTHTQGAMTLSTTTIGITTLSPALVNKSSRQQSVFLLIADLMSVLAPITPVACTINVLRS